MLQLNGQPLTLAEIAAIAGGVDRVEIAPEAVVQMEKSEYVVRRAAHGEQPVYGINTGFGKLCEVRIAADGTVKHVHALGEIQTGSDGEKEVIGTVMDLTERKLARG